LGETDNSCDVDAMFAFRSYSIGSKANKQTRQVWKGNYWTRKCGGMKAWFLHKVLALRRTSRTFESDNWTTCPKSENVM